MIPHNMHREGAGINPISIQKYWKDLYPPNLNKLAAEGKKFTDPYFPPNINSLTSKDKHGNFVDSVKGPQQFKYLKSEMGEKLDRIEWKRVTEIKDGWKVFEDKVEFDDVKQGSLGDCYFLSSITALTEYPYLIKEKFRIKNFNEMGYYEMVFFIDGEWQIVFVDDYFPYDPKRNDFAFASPNNCELWAILLEKAWAKLNGGYSNASGGLVSDPISALTGSPSEYIDHNEYENDDIFNKILKCDRQGTIMSSASKPDPNAEKKGLVESHAYTLIGAKQWKERNIYLLKLRNPWGRTEWNGKWSDNSSCWTDEYRQYFGYTNKDEGIFWISNDDYIKHYDATYICHILYGAVNKNFHFEHKEYFKKPIVFDIYLSERAKTSVRVIFKHWRFNRDIHDITHPFAIVLAKYDQNRRIEKLYGKWEGKEDVNLVEDLEAGYYVLWLYCPLAKVNDKNFKYTVQISSMSPFDVEFIGQDNSMLIGYLLLDNYRKTGQDNINSSKDYFIGSDSDVSGNGLSNLLIYNKSQNTMEITVSRKNVENAYILPPFTESKNLKLKIPPNDTAAIIGIRLSIQAVNFSHGFSLRFLPNDPKIPKVENPGAKYANYMKFNLSSRANPDLIGLRIGEYKNVGRKRAKDIPRFDHKGFLNKIAGSALEKISQVTQDSLSNEYPTEMSMLLQNYPKDNSPNINKNWNKFQSDEGTYIGEFNSNSNTPEGRGVYTWKDGNKYIGEWKKGAMCGNGMILDKDNNIVFQGSFYNGKKYGKGILNINGNERYEGEFYDDKMEGSGSYFYENGDVWEGTFKDNSKNGTGIMIKKETGDYCLSEFSNDCFLGSRELSPEEKVKVQTMRQEQKDRMDEREGQRKKDLSDYEGFEKKEEDRLITQLQQNSKDVLNIIKKLAEISADNYQNMYSQKDGFESAVKIEDTNIEAQETPEERDHRIFLEKIEEYTKKEPYMMEKFKQLNPLDKEENMEYINDTSTGAKYVGGALINEKGKKSKLVKQGRGVLYDGNSYMIGYWHKDTPHGFFFKYNNKNELIFRGFLKDDGSIDPKKPAYTFTPDGEKYIGFFKKNKMNGFGTYFFKNGDCWSGKFNDGKFDGRGKYFYENGVLSAFMTYKKNKVTEQESTNPDDLQDPNAEKFFEEIKPQYPGVIEQLRLLPPYKLTDQVLIWYTFKFYDGRTYIGQVISENKEPLGKCFISYPEGKIAYYIGYIKNTSYYEGTFYDKDWKYIYQGKFEDNMKQGFGFGKLEEENADYVGYFYKDLPHGRGVIYYPNGARFEGNFIKGEKNDKGSLINPDLSLKQDVVYKDGNIIEQSEIINLRKGKYKTELEKNFEEFEAKCKKEGYEKYMKLFLDLKPTEEEHILTMGIKQDVYGTYIGEMNSVQFMQGRGVLLNNYTKEFYVGYFANNQKSGKGIIYYDFDNPKYIGKFANDKPQGKGEYLYSEGEWLQGEFNAVGEGGGVYTFGDQSFWTGPMYAWTMNGEGEYYQKDYTSLGKKTFVFGNPAK